MQKKERIITIRVTEDDESVLNAICDLVLSGETESLDEWSDDEQYDAYLADAKGTPPSSDQRKRLAKYIRDVRFPQHRRKAQEK